MTRSVILSRADGEGSRAVAILDTVRSKLADQLKQEQRERFAKMSPADRVALAERLGREGLAAYMSANRIDRAAAIRAIKRSRRNGRKPSRCFDERD